MRRHRTPLRSRAEIAGRDVRTRRAGGRGLLAALTLLAAACASEEPWTFAVSRGVYESDAAESAGESFADHLDPGSACALVVLISLPLALDLVALPVALPHDLLVHGKPW